MHSDSKDHVLRLKEQIKHIDIEPTAEEKQRPKWDTSDKESDEVAEKAIPEEKRPESTFRYDLTETIKKGIVWFVLVLLAGALIILIFDMNKDLTEIKGNQESINKNMENVIEKVEKNSEKIHEFDKNISISLTKILERLKNKE